MANEKELHELVKAGVWEIDSQGRIWNKDKGKRIERRQSHGYSQVSKKTNGVQIHTGAHRLVYHHFKGEIPHGMVINHINGIKGDNRPENLEVVTPSENMKHAFRTGLLNSKERHNARKLTNNQVSEIRETYAIGGVTQKQIAAKYGVSRSAISLIVRGDRRKVQGGPTADYTSRRGRFAPKEVHHAN